MTRPKALVSTPARVTAVAMLLLAAGFAPAAPLGGAAHAQEPGVSGAVAPAAGVRPVGWVRVEDAIQPATAG